MYHLHATVETVGIGVFITVECSIHRNGKSTILWGESRVAWPDEDQKPQLEKHTRDLLQAAAYDLSENLRRVAAGESPF